MSHPVDFIIDRAKTALQIKTDSGLASYFGIKPNTVSAWRKRGKLNYDILFTKCENIHKEWLLTGEGEMYTQKEDDREDETKKEQESNSPTVHQPVNAQLTPAQQTINGPQFNTKLDGIHYRAIVDTGRAMIAIGSKMLPDSSIQEGDQLFIETNITPQPGDYILRKTNDAPEIAKFTTGDPPPIGVVYQLIRNYRQKE